MTLSYGDRGGMWGPYAESIGFNIGPLLSNGRALYRYLPLRGRAYIDPYPVGIGGPLLDPYWIFY